MEDLHIVSNLMVKNSTESQRNGIFFEYPKLNIHSKHFVEL